MRGLWQRRRFGASWAAAAGVWLLLALLGGRFGWAQERQAAGGQQLGFDRNDYPGDAALPVLRRHFAFAGYWLNPPPEERVSSWLGHREAMVRAGFGFVLLLSLIHI